MLGGQKFTSDMEVLQSAVCPWLGQQPVSFLQTVFRNLFIGGISVYMNLDNMLKNEIMMHCICPTKLRIKYTLGFFYI